VTRRVSVLIVDDQEPFRRAAASVVELVDEFTVVGQVSSGEAGVKFVQDQVVRLVLMDIHMPGIGGIAAADQILDEFPGTTVVLLSTYDVGDLPPEALKLAATYIRKGDFGPDELERVWRNRRTVRNPT
jgi:two-component system, NarL family, invasion response regulator UvrY